MAVCLVIYLKVFQILVVLVLFLKVRDWYLESFRDVRSFGDINDKHDELAFTEMIKMIKVRHNHVVPTMALGVQQLKKDLNVTAAFKDLEEIHQFLDRFYMSRIGIRVLIGLWQVFCAVTCTYNLLSHPLNFISHE